MVNEERLVSLFKKMCLINSPALRERQAVEFAADHLLKLGLSVVEDDAGSIIGGNAGNLIATLKGNVPGAPRIFLSAHFDTVEPTEGLVIEERDGMIKSAGNTILGADDKSGVAPAIEAVQHFVETGEAHGDVVLLLTVAEEIGLLGAGALKIEDLGLDYGYVLDTGPPVGTFVNRTATHDMLNATILGKPAHAGKNPEDGINSIQVLADAISRMKIGRIDSETTANFGIIEGGTAVNVVCPFVKVQGEARSTDIAKLEAQVEHMRQALELAATSWGAQVVIQHERHYSAYQVAEESDVVRTGQRAAKSLGLTGDLRVSLGGSDANQFNFKGVPCIVAGTGMEMIHTHQEFIRRKDLVLTAELAVELIRAAAEGTR